MTVVAIDGPAGAGKSTVARSVARALGFRYVDTGALYRAVALQALKEGVDPGDGRALGELAAALDVERAGERVLVRGTDVSNEIRGEDVTEIVSQVASHPDVRARLFDAQRRLAAGQNVVIEGRDIGTRVVPEADVKVFLTASLRERARRRALELGVGESEEAVGRLERAIAARDESDATRTASPLAVADDAVVVDSTSKPLDQVVREIVDLVQQAR